jgi:hypothetical protein
MVAFRAERWNYRVHADLRTSGHKRRADHHKGKSVRECDLQIERGCRQCSNSVCSWSDCQHRFPLAAAGRSNPLDRCGLRRQDLSLQLDLHLHRTSALTSLSALYTSAGSLVPNFDPGSTSYTLALPNAVTALTLTSIATDVRATLSMAVNAGSTATPAAGSFLGATSGVAGPSWSLPVGDSTAAIQVLAEDGSSSLTYNFAIRRISVDSSVNSLTVTAGSTSQIYSPPDVSQTLQVASGTNSAAATFSTASTASAKFAFLSEKAANDVAAVLPSLTYTLLTPTSVTSIAASWSVPSISLPLAVGDSVLVLCTVAEDGSTQSFVTVQLHVLSADASLAELLLLPALDDTVFDFSSAQHSYDATLIASISSLAFIPYSTYSLVSSISYQWNGATVQLLASGGKTSSLAVNTGSNFVVCYRRG